MVYTVTIESAACVIQSQIYIARQNLAGNCCSNVSAKRLCPLFLLGENVTFTIIESHYTQAHF